MAKRSKHNLSHSRLLSCDMGELIPIGITEVLPGDTVQHATSALVRVSPLVAPVMHPVVVAIHHWFVPNRLVWDEWEDFITGGPTGTSSAISMPTIAATRFSASGVTVGSLGDYMGLPANMSGFTTSGMNVSALPIRAYNLIYNEWYRDQDLVSAAPISTASGVDTTTSVALLNAAWEKDYFTSARPWAQKGPDISLPLGTSAPISGILYTSGNPTSSVSTLLGSGGAIPPGTNSVVNTSGSMFASKASVGASGGTQLNAANLNVYADLSQATAATVNQIRQAMALQRMEEARARYGSRYSEYLRYLGVAAQDSRLQRPEYLGGGRQTIQFSEVLQTGVNASDQGVGNLRGHGIGALRSNRYRRHIPEHGYIISMMVVRPKTMYYQGIPRTWNRRIKEDYFQPELQHIGQQQVLNKEIYAAHGTPDGVFGYQDRYDEYRRNESGVSGEFRELLNYWHYGRVFASAPALNASLVSCVPTKRVNAVQTNDVLYVQCYHQMVARRIVSRESQNRIF